MTICLVCLESSQLSPADGGTKCICIAGFFLLDSTSVRPLCQPCVTDTYQHLTGSTSCASCPAQNSVPNAGLNQLLPDCGCPLQLGPGMGCQDGLRADNDDCPFIVLTETKPIRMCCDIFAAARLWRGCLLTTGHLSCCLPIVVCAGRVGKVDVAGRWVAWACSGHCAAICVRVFSSVSHL